MNTALNFYYSKNHEIQNDSKISIWHKMKTFTDLVNINLKLFHYLNEKLLYYNGKP